MSSREKQRSGWRFMGVWLSLVALLVAACGNGTDDVPSDGDEGEVTTEEPSPEGEEPTTEGLEDVDLEFVIFSGNEAHLEMYRSMISEISGTGAGVGEVEMSIIPPAEIAQKLGIQLAGGNPPDFGWLPQTELPAYRGAGALTDLSEFVANDSDYNFEDFFDAAMSMWQEGDGLFGIPFSTSPFFLVYNVDMFEAAGATTPAELYEQGNWTWESMADAALSVQSSLPAGQYAFQHFGQAGAPTFDDPYRSLFQLLTVHGGAFWDLETKECLLDSPESIQGLTAYHDMVFADGTAAPPGEQADFYAGQAAMVGAQVSRIPPLADADFQWEAVPMPAGPAGDTQYFGQSAFVVFSASENVPQAVELVKFLTNEENVLRHAEFFPPARESILNSPEFTETHPILSPSQVELLIRDGVSNGEPFDSPTEWPQIVLQAEAIWDRVWTPDADLDVLTGELCEVIEPLL